MMYYSGDVWRSDGSVASKPNMMVNVPWDGSYPWRTGGVSAKLPNGDTFKVTINPALSDPSWAGYAFHTYNEVPLICYSFHKDKLYQLNDGKWCSSAYLCNHSGPPVFAPKPAPIPAPQDGLKTSITSSKDFAGIYAQDVGTVFGHLKSKIGNGRDCMETAVTLNAQCSITFKCHSARDVVSLSAIADFLINDMPQVPGFASYEEDTYQICKKYDSRPGHEGQCLAYTDKVDTYLITPKSLDVKVESVPMDGSGRQPKVQATLGYVIDCVHSSPKCGFLCDFLKTAIVRWGGAWFVINHIW
jgi:hypothetical protein